MKTNKILERMRAGRKALGAVLNFPSEEIVELMGIAGLDFVSFDGQHGAFTRESLDRLCRAADQAGLTPIARVPEIEASTILDYLDRGIMGITGPNIDTRSQAVALAEACRFSPEGKRSFGSTRGNRFGFFEDRKGWMTHVNANILVIAQIESATAVANLPDILSVPGIDLFTGGPNDLAQSMGFPGQPDHPKVKEVMTEATMLIHRAGKKLAHDVMESISISNVVFESAQALLGKQQKA
ncbi:MAG: siderophore biosynthesis protein SbnG [Verrucomicrobia bacterium]|nr:siderophore biosynthesis protein SbnG [Verrucomicrobiota bacterium]